MYAIYVDVVDVDVGDDKASLFDSYVLSFKINLFSVAINETFTTQLNLPRFCEGSSNGRRENWRCRPRNPLSVCDHAYIHV